tara:strand:- start:333 stop:1208 length:876 start_codon:yes stop_codon:yes gene_type:complete
VVQQRYVEQIVTAHYQREGGGFMVRRPMPTRNLPLMDPFLLLDELGPVVYAPGEAIGAPDHPHRGFETVTYLLQGGIEHKDSAGHVGRLGAGDVQWMTAGSGIVHSEMPTQQFFQEGGAMHGFQLWVNLPAALKTLVPRYQEIPREKIPHGLSKDGLAHVVVIAGRALGVEGVIDTHTSVHYQDWTLKPGADVLTDVDSKHSVGVYVFSGQIKVGCDLQHINAGQFAVLREGLLVRLVVLPEERTEARLLLLAGLPVNEPVVRHGPFVMSTEEELQQAVLDYQSGRMGKIS